MPGVWSSEDTVTMTSCHAENYITLEIIFVVIQLCIYIYMIGVLAVVCVKCSYIYIYTNKILYINI